PLVNAAVARAPALAAAPATPTFMPVLNAPPRAPVSLPPIFLPCRCPTLPSSPFNWDSICLPAPCAENMRDTYADATSDMRHTPRLDSLGSPHQKQALLHHVRSFVQLLGVFLSDAGDT